jgi:Dolichyl-phosphate-mannose-protein mannosyltransferase
MSESKDSSPQERGKARSSTEEVGQVREALVPNPDDSSTLSVAQPRKNKLTLLRFEKPIAAAILVCVVLFSLYVRVADYGFYEDDYWGIVPWFKTPLNTLWTTTISHLLTWPTGRPLNHILPKWFSWLGYHLAGVQGIYFLGFLVHSTNAFLLYLLLRRWLGRWAALFAGCLFVLLPIDTTRIFLLHSAHVHTSLTFLLVALLVGRTRYWLASFPIAGLCLLSYETAFLPFIIFPLFLLKRGTRISRGLIHLAGCGLVLLIVFAVRLHLGDERASSVVSGPAEMIWRMVSSLWIGPETDRRTLETAILQAPHAQPPFAFLFAALVGFLLLITPRFIKEPASVSAEGPNRQNIIAVFLGGLAAWIFAYALTLTNYPPTQEAGRLTSTHTAAVFGLACVISAAAAYFRSFTKPYLRDLVTVLMSVFIGWLTLYSFHIQSGFASAWNQECKFWRQVLELCPDITPNTRIFLVGKEPRQNEFILSNSWADPLVLGDAYPWADSPILFYYDGMGAAADIQVDNGQVSWKPHYWDHRRETLDLNNLIVLRDDGVDLTRIDEVKIKEIPFPLETKRLVEPQLHPSPTPLTDFGRFLLQP